jgi:hypothetical protein
MQLEVTVTMGPSAWFAISQIISVGGRQLTENELLWANPEVRLVGGMVSLGPSLYWASRLHEEDK